MRITLFGASGASGHALVAAALVRGHALRAFCRPGASPPPGVTETLLGALDDVAAVTKAIAGAHAVVSALGPRPPHRDAFCAAATASICAAMAAAGPRRFVCQTGAMIGELRPNVSWAMRWLARRFAAARPAVARDRAEQEALVAASALDWTLVKPPRLRDADRPERAVVGADVRVGLFSSISREALAREVIGLLENGRFLRQAVYLRRA